MSLAKTYVKNKNSYKVSFELPKELIQEGKEVRLLGEFNNWEWEIAPPMKAIKNNLNVKIELKAGKKYEYRYFVDRSYWLNDSNADAYVPTPFYDTYNCVVDLNVPAPKAKKAKSKIDFTKIEGIGPKISELLVNGGLKSYADLANAKSATLKGILSAAGNRYAIHDPSTWPKQSKLLEAGKLEELKKLQTKLKGGRKYKIPIEHIEKGPY